ncbi:MAG: hypothetical protein AABP62_01305 [Planctomycetota bacterium]
MSDRPPVSESPSPTPPGKKPRSPVERVIVWGGIAILLGVLAFEARQKYSYDPTVGHLRKVFSEDTEKYVKLSEIRPMIAGSPSEVKTPHERRSYQRIDLKWPSLFKDYRVQLIVESEGDDPLVAGFTTPGATDPDSEPVAQQTASTETAHAGPTMPAGGMMPMGGAGMGGPGGRGAGRPGAAGRPGGGSGGGPGAAVGGGGPPRGRGLVAIAQREEVVAELKLTEEQTAKLTELQAGARGAFQTLQGMPEDERAAAMKTMREGQEKSVSEILDEPQFARLLQLVWRETGLASVERDDVAKGLGLSDEQREKFRPILADRQSGQRELRDAPPEVAAQKRKEWDDQLRAVLTEEQAKQWEELLGAPAPEPAKAAASATN